MKGGINRWRKEREAKDGVRSGYGQIATRMDKAQSGLKLECQLTIDGGYLLSSDSHRRMEIAFTLFLKGA
jgi:hypothetical protein